MTKFIWFEQIVRILFFIMVITIYIAVLMTIAYMGKNTLRPDIFRNESSTVYLIQTFFLVLPNFILFLAVVCLLRVLWKYHHSEFYSLSPAILVFFFFETLGLIIQFKMSKPYKYEPLDSGWDSVYNMNGIWLIQ